MSVDVEPIRPIPSLPQTQEESDICSWGDNEVFKAVRSAFQILANLFLWMISCFSRKPLSERASEYYFSQQYNDSCHLSPYENYKRLRELETQDFDLSQMKSHTRREWLAKNQSFLQSWHLAIQKGVNPAKYPHLARYIRGAVQNGSIFPHFYNAEGSLAFSGIKGLIDLGEAPFFLVDLQHAKEVRLSICGCIQFGLDDMMDEELLKLHIPIVLDKKGYLIYNKKTEEYQPLQEVSGIYLHVNGEVEIDHELMTEEDYETYAIPRDPRLQIQMVAHKALGFERVAIIKNLPSGLQENGRTYFAYQMGLYKMILLASGVDANNQVIDEDHELYRIVLELRSLMSESSDNPWNPARMNKEQLLQYHLAEIFLKNPKLAQKASKVVELLHHGYGSYLKLTNGEFHRANSLPYNPAHLEAYLPGREQALAYYFTQNLRLLWYFANSPIAGIRCMEMDLPLEKTISTFIHNRLKRKANQLHELDEERFSYLDVWKEIKEMLQERIQTGQTDSGHFVTFDEHGWVLSLHPRTLELQRKHSKAFDPELLEELGFAGVESWLSSFLGKVWYKVDSEPNPARD